MVAAITFVAAQSMISPDKTSSSLDERSTTSTFDSSAQIQTTTNHGLTINATRVYYDAADSQMSQYARLLIYDLTLSNMGNENLTLHNQDFFLIANTYYNEGLTGTYSYSNVGIPSDLVRGNAINGTFSIAPDTSISDQVAFQVQLNNVPNTIEYNDSRLNAYAYSVPLVPMAVSVLNYSAFNVTVIGAENVSDFHVVMTPGNVSLAYQNQPVTGFYQGQIISINLNVTYGSLFSKNDLTKGSITAISITDDDAVEFITGSISPSFPVEMTPGSSAVIHLFLITPSDAYSGGLDFTLTVID